MQTDPQPEEFDENPNPTPEVSISGAGSGRRRRRVKIRKRIRIKKKPSAKKKVRKIAERAFWFLIIAGFITSLIVMVVQLDIKDEKLKQYQRKKTPTGKSY